MESVGPLPLILNQEQLWWPLTLDSDRNSACWLRLYTWTLWRQSWNFIECWILFVVLREPKLLRCRENSKVDQLPTHSVAQLWPLRRVCGANTLSWLQLEETQPVQYLEKDLICYLDCFWFDFSRIIFSFPGPKGFRRHTAYQGTMWLRVCGLRFEHLNLDLQILKEKCSSWLSP